MNKNGSLSPAPEYTPPEKSDAREEDYQDSKLGFSGSHHSQQPNYDSKQGYI